MNQVTEKRINRAINSLPEPTCTIAKELLDLDPELLATRLENKSTNYIMRYFQEAELQWKGR